MGDIKLFKQSPVAITELPGHTMQIEKSLQTLFERNLEPLLGVRFLASEYYTGKAHNGRIDTLGIDEDRSPVIIEYKRTLNENVMAQGLYYLDWLLDHKKEFAWLVMEKLGAELAKEIDWDEPRVVCIAGDFTRYDQHAAKQMPGNIELLRYRRYGEDLLMLELVHAPNLITTPTTKVSNRVEVVASAPLSDSDPYEAQRINYRMNQTTGALKDLFDTVWQFLLSLGDDVQVSERKQYIAFKRLKNFACLEVYPQSKVVTIYLKVDPSKVTLEEGFTRDVTNIGHYGTGNLQVSLYNVADFERAQPLMLRSYERS
jgi:predicted transport protein